MSKNKQIQEVPLSPIVEPTLNMLIANLIGDEARTYQMAENKFIPEEIMEYPFHARILEVIYYLEAVNQSPTATHIKDILRSDGQEEIANFVDEILTHQSVDLDVLHPAHAIKNIYLVKRNALVALEKAGEIINSPMGLPIDRVQDAVALLQGVTQQAKPRRARHIIEVSNTFIRETVKRHERVQQGLPPGPSWPWQNLRNLVPVMRRGNLVSLMGKSKWGKTTVGILCAEHWAWVQGYRTYIYALETTEQEYFERQVAHHCLVPTWYGTSGQWDMTDPDSMANRAYEDFQSVKLEEGLIGDLFYLEVPGVTLGALESLILEHEKEAQKDGVECVHLIDYYQLIDKSDSKYRYDNVPLNSIAQELKRIASDNKLYLMTLVQEQEASDSGAFDNEFPKGGNEIVKVSQVFMRLARTYASNDVQISENGVQATDALGNPRWMHRAGELSGHMEIQVTHANADKKGSARLLAEMAYFRIKDAPSA